MTPTSAKSILKTFLILLILGGIVFYFRAPIMSFVGILQTRIQSRYFPCVQPIAYSIGTFDTRFGISKDEYLKAIRDAEAIWESAIGKELFNSTADGSLKINLIYDSRQEATVKLQSMGLTIRDDKASYDELRAKYDLFNAQYATAKAAFESRVAAFEARRSAYEKEVSQWNRRGGATKDAYASLEEERKWLDREVLEINKLKDGLNAIVDEINALAVVLNRLAESLNIDVARFNNVGQERGGEFEEGSYQTGPEGDTIDIYQFDDRAKLVRVLAHELGHALGLEHLEDPKAIMYRLNNGVNAKLTAADLAALKARCGIQ